MSNKKYLESESLKDAMWKNFYKEEDKWESMPEADFLANCGELRHWFQLGFGAGLDAVVKAKPADVKPVVRGEWEEGNYVGEIGSESEWFCSECGYVVLSEDYPENWHYCPNCGAEMRKGEAIDEP